jgi:protein gp37
LWTTDLAFAAQFPHIWWGVSVENRQHGLPRVKDLRDMHPAMAFLSVEPLLEDLGKVTLDGINWVIVGGESGASGKFSMILRRLVGRAFSWSS